MTDFAASWNLSRGRFVDAVQGLNQEQLNWRLHPDCLTIGEMAIHVAGVEIFFISQLLDQQMTGQDLRVRAASTEGVVNENAFPFAAEEITPSLVDSALSKAKEMTEPVITHPSESVRAKQIVSALGPVIDGSGALARLAFHPGYHQGQAHLIKSAPGFPS